MFAFIGLKMFLKWRPFTIKFEKIVCHPRAKCNFGSIYLTRTSLCISESLTLFSLYDLNLAILKLYVTATLTNFITSRGEYNNFKLDKSFLHTNLEEFPLIHYMAIHKTTTHFIEISHTTHLISHVTKSICGWFY